MVIRVGINGFGRIGRVIFRTCLQNPEIELSAINDPAIDIDYICYLIKFDSTHGKFKGTVTHTENEIKIDDRTIKVFREKLPPTVPWQTAGVQYVVEASGMFTGLDKASGHLASDGVKRVIVTAPSVDVPMVILGVNDNMLNIDQKVLSCASSTLYCLAPMVKILEDTYGVTEGFITSIHAMTPSLKPLDGLCLRGKHWRDHRSIHQNIIPASTGACKALAKIIPQVKDKMSGLAFRVPIVNVSVLDLTIRLSANTSMQDILKNVEKASNTYLHNIVKISNDEAVSSDFIGDSHSCILDADSSLQLKPDFYKLICWYENEYSYACRAIDSIFFSEKQFSRPMRLPCKMTYVRAKFTKKHDEVQQTERNIKEMSIECNYNTDVPKVLCSTSQDTTLKQTKLNRPLILRKPSNNSGSNATTSTNNRDNNKKKNEIFKIWNDNTETPNNAARQNRSSFFTSCLAFSTQTNEKPDNVKTQERLENVKKEFSKMVNITEDLLKKSISNKLELESTNISSEAVKAKSQSNGGLIVGPYEGPQTASKEKPCNKLPSNNPIFKICGDFKNRNVISPTNQSSIEEVINYDRNENMSNYSVVTAELRNDNSPERKKPLKSSPEETSMRKQNFNITSTSPSKNTTTQINETTKKTTKSSNATLGVKNPVKKKVTLVEGTSNSNLHVQCIMADKKDLNQSPPNRVKTRVSDTENEEVEIKIIEASISEEVCACETRECETQSSKCKLNKEEKQKIINMKDFSKYLLNKDYNMQVIDEELKKRNIVLVNTQKEQNSDTNLNSCSFESARSSGDNEDMRKNTNLNRQILDNFNRYRPESMLILADDISQYSPENTITTISNGDGKIRKPDLYDKLDSASATDSNNSFEINERKSQVIHITDLTNSLEDLARLDKICRIIEISDELSDKLFSPLDKSDTLTNTQQKKWSFKDLCERIQLDEFCNKVFGKNV